MKGCHGLFIANLNSTQRQRAHCGIAARCGCHKTRSSLSAPYRSLENQFRFSKSRAELSKVGDAYRQVKVVVEQLVVSDVVPRLSKRTTELAEFGDADNTRLRWCQRIRRSIDRLRQPPRLESLRPYHLKSGQALEHREEFCCRRWSIDSNHPKVRHLPWFAIH